jgi:hypothetical protein
MRISPNAAAALLIVAAPVGATPAEYAEARLELSTDRAARRDIAVKYRDDPGASERPWSKPPTAGVA